MYAHQVIDSYRNSSHNKAEFHVGLLKNAIHFYFGDVSNLPNNKVFDGTPYFSEHLWNDAKPPYALMCLHFDMPESLNFLSPGVIADKNHKGIVSKIVISVAYNGKELSLLSWVYRKNTRLWMHKTYVVIFSGDGEYSIAVEDESAPFNEDDITTEVHYTNLALMVLNCKNITTIDNPPPEKLNKKRIRNGKQPLFTYKTLILKPSSKKQETQEAQGLWENRVHLCRGHFKTYTDKNPLFGSHTGRYWWQPVVRGNKEKGIVMKDYEIRTA